MRFLNGKGWMPGIWPKGSRSPKETDSGGTPFRRMAPKALPLIVGLLLSTLHVGWAQVNKGEYFFDSDPGVGSGFSIPISSTGDSVTINQSIPTTGLQAGFHVLYLRTRMSKRWSETESRSFFLLSATSATSGPVSQLEYFFDSDPGVGLGTKINLSPSADSSEKTAVIPIASLATGFHVMYIRAKNNRGWSLTEARSFYITPSASSVAGPVFQLEYFFDSDPGVGLGNKISISPSSDSSEKTAVIPISSLAAGFHVLYIRAKNNRGWSMTESRSFYVSPIASATAGPISQLEYFFDSDPGVGAGAKITVSPSADSAEKSVVIPVSSLSSGFHTLYLRSKNNKGWSQTESRGFYVVPPSAVSSGPVARMEYFIDTDPGIGLGTALTAFTSGDSVQISRVIAIPSTLTTGTHKLYVRSQTSDKRWAITEVQDFTVDCAEISITATQTQICSGASTTLSFASGNQPGTYQWYRNGTLIPGATSFSFTTTQSGGYTLRYQFGTCLDTSDVLAIGVGTAVTATATASGSTNICAGSTVDLTANAGTGFTYQWLRNSTPISGATNQQLTGVNSSGAYSVIVSNSTGCKDTSNAIAVTVTPLPPKPSISGNGPLTFCDGGSVTLTTTASSGRWSTGETTQSIVVSGSAVIRDTAIVNGCKIVSDPVTITENPCNHLPGSGNAMAFDGVDDRVEIASPGADQKPTTAITVEAWVYSTGSPEDFAGIVSNAQDNGSDEAGYYLTRRSNGNVEFLLSTGAGFTGPSTPLPQNQWVHVAATYDGVNSQLYLNGILKSTVAKTGTIDWVTAQANTVYTIGCYVDANESLEFSGKIDEVKIWNVARTQAQIQADMCRKIANSSGVSSLIAYFNFDETGGNAAYNQAGPDVDASLTNGVVRETSGAPIGDDAVTQFQSSGLPSVSLSYLSQETFQASFTSGTATGDRGAVVYIVKEKPGSTSGITGIGTNDRYYGVFAAGITNPEYTGVYTYTGNPFVTAANENNLALFKRADNSVSTWTNAFGVRNTTANTLTVTGQSTEYMLGIGAGGEVNPGTIGTDQTISCSNLTPAAFTSLADATTTTGFAITYQWQDSTKGGSWKNITGATAATYTSGLLNDTTWFRRKATASTFSQVTNIIVVNVQAVAAGDPAVVPSNSWNLYAWNGADMNLGSGLQYRGFYSVGGLSVNTLNEWGSGASPSSAAAWQGCSVQTDNFTWSLRRKGFPAGNYIMNVPANDDQINVLVNGTSVFTASCCGGATNITLGALGSTDTIEVRMVEFGGSANVSFNMVTSELQAGSIGTNQLICSTGTPSLLTNSTSAFGGPTTLITYQWQDSTAGGTWQNIATATAATFQPPSLTDTTWYRRIAKNGTQSGISNVVQVSVTTPAGDPAVFPTNLWNVYAYNGGDLALGSGITYTGFYSVNSLNVNTSDQWNNQASPSSAGGFQGCPTQVDNFTFTVKRKGFPSGNYTLNILGHDDQIQVYKNGTNVFEHIGCCDAHLGIDLGALNANTQLEFRIVEGGGSAYVNFELIPSAFQGGEIAASQTVCSGNSPSALTSVSEAGGGGITTITYQWQDSTAGGSWQNIDAATGLGYQPEILTVSTYFRRKATGNTTTVFSNEVLITVTPGPSVTVAPNGPLTFCQGESRTLTGIFSTGATRQWLRNNVAISGETGTTLSVAQSGTYKAVAFNGSCTDTSNAVVINVTPKPAPLITPGGPLTLCQGSSITLDWANPVAGQTIQWKKDGNPVAGGNSLSVNAAGGYYVVATVTATGCKDSSSVVVINVVNPQVTPIGPLNLCTGTTQTLTVANTGTASIQWFRNNTEIPGAVNPTLDVSTGGTYRVDASVGTSCTVSSNDVVVTPVTPPAASITPPSTNEFCQGASLTLEANTGTGLSYQWKRNNQNISGATNPSLVVTQSGDYTVQVTNSGGCSTLSASVTINELQNITWFTDVDGDHYGTGATVQNCTRPLHGFLAAELSATTGDCNDNDASVNPDRQFFTFSGSQGFASALASPLTGTSYTSFRFEVTYTDLNNNAPPATFPRVVLDYEGNGQLNNANDRTILMTQVDNKDLTTSDGKKYFATVNSLPPGQNYTTRILTSIGNCATTIGPFNYPDVFILSDLQIFANDITFSNTNPDVSSPLTVSAVVHNVSDFSAQNFVVHLVNQYNPSIVYPDIVVANLAPHTDQTVTWNITTPAEPAWCPMQVLIDFTDVIQETNELDNSAIRPFVNGPYNVPGEITVSPSVSPSTVVGVSGASVTLVGTANYSGTAVPLQDPSVAGAQVTFTITPGGQTYTTYTNSSGQINFSFYVPLTPGVYTITGTITDFTLTTNFTTTFVVVPPVCLADLTASVSVSGNNIVEGESITGNIRVRNVGCEPTTDSTVLSIGQSGGLPVMANVKVPPLAVNAFYDVAIPAITFDDPGTYSICGTADGTFLVNEQSEGNNTGCQIISVIPFLPDIYPTGCGVGGNIYLSSQVYTHGFSFYNSGGSATGPFTVRIIRSLNGTPLDTFDRLVPNLARQSGGSVSIDVTYDQVGSYSYFMACDIPVPPGVVVETNESNNTSNCGIVVLAPQTDLYVSSCENFDVDPVDPPFPGSITLKARVTNGGNLTASAPITVRFTRTSGTTDDVVLTSDLAPGQSVLVTKTIAATAPGTDTATVEVDPENAFIEFSEANNKTSNTLCHESAPVDNYCGYSWWSSTYLINQAIFLNVPVVVKGMYNISELKVRFFVSGPGLNGTLNLGDATLSNVSETCGCPYIATLPVNFAFPQEGEYIFTFVTDPDNVYTECNETNNTLVRRVKVSGLPDMRMLSQGINPSLLNPDVGEPITIDANYENIGLANIDQVMKVKLLVDEIPIDSQMVNGLVNGDNFTVNFSTPWSSTLVGSHIIRTIIDADNVVEEGNESNNEATRAVIVGAAANLYFQVFQPSNASPAIGQNISINARIGNNGDEAVEGAVVFYYIDNLGDTIQIAIRSVALDGHDSVDLSVPWTVADNNTILIGKIINASIMEFNYEDNIATAPIGGFAVSLSSTPACAGKPNGTVTATPTGGTGPFTYQWSTGFTGDSILTAGPGLYNVQVTDANDVTVQVSGSIPNLPGKRYFLDADGDGHGNPAVDSVDCVQPVGYVPDSIDCNDANVAVYKKTPKPTIFHTGSLSFCLGNSVLLSVAPVNGIQYEWSTHESASSITVTTAGSFTVTAKQDSGCVVTSNPVVTQVITNLVPTASIIVSPDSVVCTGTQLTFTATTSGGGSNPVSQWLMNGNVAATGGSTFSGSSFANNDRIELRYISSESCANPDTVISNFIRLQIGNTLTANAGADQVICSTTTNMTASGSGSWTLLSGTGTLANPNSAATPVSGLGLGNNAFIWTVTSGNCPSASDTVVITVLNPPSAAFAGQDQSLCSNETSLQATSPAIGTGSWSLLSGSGDIADPAEANTTVTNLGVGNNAFVWTINNGICAANTDTVLITRLALPSLSNAGPDQTICLDVTTLAAETPTVGSGKWRLVQGTATFTDSLSPSMAVAGLSVGENKFIWIVGNGTCPESLDTVSILVNPFPTTAVAGQDQVICSDSVILSGNTPQLGTGSWTLISGTGTLADPANPATVVRNLGVGANILVWSVALGNCPASTDTVLITREQAPGISLAGEDQTICRDTISLNGNVPAVGTGLWSVISGAGILANPTLANTRVQNLSPGLNRFAWTITNGSCPASIDTVDVVVASPPAIQAGTDTTLCSSGLALHPSPVGGTWRILSGAGVLLGDSVAGLSVGLNDLEYTLISSEGCTSKDTVRLTRVDSTHGVQAGPDQILCSQTTSTLAATAPASGVGTWTVISGTAIVEEPNNPTSTVTGLSFGDHILRWTVANDPCPAVFDEIKISITNSLAADAGKDSTICGNSYTLSGNGQGEWTRVSGTGTIQSPASASTQVTNLGIGVNVFQWKLISTGCPSDSDQVSITVTAPATVAVAGSDQTLCADSANLSGNVPTVGTGMWTVISGTGVVADPLAASTTVHQLSTGVNQLVWMIMNDCGENSDTVTLTVQAPASVANAGPGQSVCDTFTVLAAEVPAVGTGSWSVASGSGTFSNLAQPDATVQGLSIGLNQFVWTVSSGTCSSSSDTVSVFRFDTLVTPDAGFDQLLCNNEVSLSASPATFTGTGLWTLVSGSGDIQSANNPSTAVTNLGAGVNVLAWTYTNGVCPAKSDTVKITVEEQPSQANAGLDQVLCLNTATLAADPPSAGTGSWTVVSGGATVTDPASPTSGVTSLSTGDNLLVWSVSNGICPASTDTVRLTLSPVVSVVNAGADTAVCGSLDTLNAQAPTVGVWTTAAGTSAQILEPTNPNSPVSGMQPGINQFIWTAGVAPCPTKSDTVKIVSNPSVAANAGLSFAACSDTATLNAISPGSFGTGLWSVDQGTANFANPSLANTFVSSLGLGLNVLRWTISVPTCPDVSDTVAVFRVQNNLSIHADTGICFNVGDSLTLSVPAGITSYTWSTGETTPSITLHQADTVVLTVVTPQNCTFTDTIRVQAVICDPVRPMLGGSGMDIRYQPNPANRQVQLSLQSMKPRSLTLKLVNSLGQEVVPAAVLQAGPRSEYTLPVDDLPNGVYSIQVQGDQVNWTGRVVVQH